MGSNTKTKEKRVDQPSSTLHSKSKVHVTVDPSTSLTSDKSKSKKRAFKSEPENFMIKGEPQDEGEKKQPRRKKKNKLKPENPTIDNSPVQKNMATSQEDAATDQCFSPNKRKRSKPPCGDTSQEHNASAPEYVKQENEETAGDAQEDPPKKKRKPRTIKGDKPKEDKPLQVPKLKKKGKKKRKIKEIIPKDVDYQKEKGIEYLELWRDDRESWKFQKLKQIWLIDNMLDDSKISEELFPVFLEYVSCAKGQILKVILEKANVAIKAVEDSKEVDINDIKYHRSRKIMQSLGEN